MTRDLRKYARQTNVQLIAGAVLLLLIVGDGLIYLFYGGGAAILGLLCILTAIIPIVLTILALLALDWIRKRADHD
jgi:hypothetical protein